LISQNLFLKNLAETGKLIAFAEDLFIIAGNKVEAEDALNACHLLKNYGLNINLKKTQIMTDREDMDGVEEISGVKIVEKSDTRNLPLLRQTETPGICESTSQEVHGIPKTENQIKRSWPRKAYFFFAFYRSMLIYCLTPVYAAAAINEEEINKLETQIIRE
jgi:hypothetical protein